MRIRSKFDVGFRPNGGVLVRRGDNDIDESKLTESERALLDALLAEKRVERLPDAETPPVVPVRARKRRKAAKKTVA